MECALWKRRVEDGSSSSSWLINELNSPDALISSKHYFEKFLENEKMASKDLRDIIQLKAEKHREYYKNLAEIYHEDIPEQEQMAKEFLQEEKLSEVDDLKDRLRRQRRTGVYEIGNYQDGTIFKSVKSLRENYLAMLQKTMDSFKKEGKTLEIDDFLQLPATTGSGYSTGASDDEKDKSWECNKVQRCGSNDSAMGQSEDELVWRERKFNDFDLNHSYSETIKSPYSPRGSIDHDNVPTRTLLESQCVPFPIDRKLSDCVSDSDYRFDSRRQSCFTDDGDEHTRYRYWRTPSVVVSDYSDDIMGLTLEDIEYIRNQRRDNSSPDSSLHSSCSNLNYCGSTISSLESDYVLKKPYRKSSNCSTCSTLSDDEGESFLPIKKETSAIFTLLHPIEMTYNGNSLPMSAPLARPKSLMETLLVAKMEQVTKGHSVRTLVRTDSVDSTSSMGSVTSINSDVCRCDDCLLGIADLYAQEAKDSPIRKKGCLSPNHSPSRSPSPGSDSSPRLSRRSSPFRHSASSGTNSRRGSTTSTGYDQYQKSLLEVPVPTDYGDASSDDLSSEWDSDVPEIPKLQLPKPSGWRKLRNIVQWTPFFQTYKKQRYPWVQLAGHQGNFKAGPDQGTILKKLCPKEEKCFKVLMKDVLRPYVPEYKGLVASDDGECSYIQLQDLLGDFISPCVMDCKIGVRTYLEEELAKAKEKPKLRKDMYEKMCQIDIDAPSEEEHKLKGVTKPRYMVWRETISSTATLGFRIEGIRKADGTSSKDFKTTKSKEQIIKAFQDFTENFPHAVPKYIQRLKAIKATLESSQFFNDHEVIGSSLLFVHDRHNANVWLIDFAKTIKLPDDVKISHSSKWKVGNHEDGYLIGVNNLISIFMTMLERQPVSISPPLALPDPPQLHEKDNT